MRPRPLSARPFLGSLVLLTMLLLPGCRGTGSGEAPDVAVDVAISPTPPTVGPARLLISLADSAGLPVEGASVQVEGNMSHAGMVPVRGAAEPTRQPGQYAVPDFRFTMAGDWFLTVEAILQNGDTLRTRVPTNVVGSPGGGR